MAKIPTFICFGNSNTDGFASFDNLSNSAFQRWTGIAPPTTYPIDVTVPGVRIWTPKLPSTPATEYTSTTATSNTVTMTGFNYDGPTHDNRWLFVQAGTGIGQYRKISSGSGTQATVSSNWTTNPTASTVEFLSNSHTCDTGSSANEVISLLAVGNPAGKWLVFISGALVGRSYRIQSGSSFTLALESPILIPTIVGSEIVLAESSPAAGDGFVICSNTATVDGVSTNIAANGALRDLRFYQGYAYHFSTGFEYPNFKSYPFDNLTLTSGSNSFRVRDEINWLPELAWQIRQSVSTAPVFIHLGVPSASMATQYTGGLAKKVGALGRMYDVAHLDYQPSSPTGLYNILTADIANTAAALVSEGNEIDIQGIFTVVSDVDAFSSAQADKALENIKLIVRSLREFIDAGGYSSKSGSKIPWVAADVAGTVWSSSTAVNSALQQVDEDDPYLKRVDTSSYTLESDNVHWDAAACQLFGVDAYEAWLAALSDESDATRVQDDLPKLSEIRTKVKRRYERTVSSNDATNAQIDLFINDSIREVYNTLGDQAWFLRKMETLTLGTQYPGSLTLSRRIKRLLRVDRADFPGTPVRFKAAGYTDQGRLQISLMDYSGGPFVAHYIVLPKDLEQDNDVTLIPHDHIELVVLLTCKRLAEAGGNAAIATYYAVEIERLWKYAKRDAMRYDRVRDAALEDNTFGAPPSWRL